MCEVCGCDDGAEVTTVNLQTGQVQGLDGRLHPRANPHTHDHHDHHHHDGVHHHNHDHHPPHGHSHEHVHADGTRHSHPHHAGYNHQHAGEDGASIVEIETRVLAKNDALARRNRALFAQRRMFALNLMGTPGAGKTTVLERTIRDLQTQLFVIEGDQATVNDAQRIRTAGAPVVQVNTGTGCHLDAEMVSRGLEELAPPDGGLIVIENVGNLVCPALFDLGERRRVVVFSVTEGDDKPLKYPHMFRAADLVLINKVDLLPYVDFDVERAMTNARSVRPDVSMIKISARNGEGLDEWYAWLSREREGCAAMALEHPLSALPR